MRVSGRSLPCHYLVAFVEKGNRIHDALLTRLSNDDDMEKNLSTFASEMASSAMILGSSASYICGSEIDIVILLRSRFFQVIGFNR
jgi:broad-specificity NMP kinase